MDTEQFTLKQHYTLCVLCDIRKVDLHGEHTQESGTRNLYQKFSVPYIRL